MPTVLELKAMAKARGIKGFSKMLKGELEAALAAAAPAAAAPARALPGHGAYEEAYAPVARPRGVAARAKELPADIQKKILGMVPKEFNLAKVFTTAGSDHVDRGHAILAALDVMGNQMLDRGADAGKVTRLFFKQLVDPDTGKEHLFRTFYPKAEELEPLAEERDEADWTEDQAYELEENGVTPLVPWVLAVPTKEQVAMLNKGFKHTTFEIKDAAKDGRTMKKNGAAVKVEITVSKAGIPKTNADVYKQRIAEEKTQALAYMTRAAKPDFFKYLASLDAKAAPAAPAKKAAKAPKAPKAPNWIRALRAGDPVDFGTRSEIASRTTDRGYILKTRKDGSIVVGDHNNRRLPKKLTFEVVGDNLIRPPGRGAADELLISGVFYHPLAEIKEIVAGTTHGDEGHGLINVRQYYASGNEYLRERYKEVGTFTGV